jgi:hypothetical protein
MVGPHSILVSVLSSSLRHWASCACYRRSVRGQTNPNRVFRFEMRWLQLISVRGAVPTIPKARRWQSNSEAQGEYHRRSDRSCKTKSVRVFDNASYFLISCVIIHTAFCAHPFNSVAFAQLTYDPHDSCVPYLLCGKLEDVSGICMYVPMACSSMRTRSL